MREITVQKKLVRFGGSVGLRLTKEAELIGLKEGDIVKAIIYNDKEE